MRSQIQPTIAEVAVNVPLSRSFHYSIPVALQGEVQRGHRVLIPFGPRTTTGICVGFPDESEYPRLKDIREILHPDCRFDDHLLALTKWIADYYRASWGEVLEAALPPSIRSGKPEKKLVYVQSAARPEDLHEEASKIKRRAPARSRILEYLAEHSGPHLRSELIEACTTRGNVLKKLRTDGWIEEKQVIHRPDPYRGNESTRKRVEVDLNRDQARALEHIQDACREGEFRPILLHGVTGSGKTEVYLRALRQVIGEGRRGLVLVPEISLTPQTVGRFREGLAGAHIAVLHSMLSPTERTGQWRDIQEGKAQLVIGARSSAFAPIPDLGLIIVDEEHEPSYKQESSPRYNGRDVAVVRARLLGIPIVLGSATPSLESMTNAQTGKYDLLEMKQRATSHDLPLVSIVPLEPSFYRSDGSGLVSRQLDHQIKRCLQAGEQILIFLNRRGFSTYLHCMRCGFVLECEHCAVSMTYHRRGDHVRCHYCGASRPVPKSCPDCQMPGPKKSGAGTEKVVDALKKMYPEARIARLDRDTVTTHTKLKKTLADFAAGEHNMLVGTQMIAKGHDFPGVSLVGILLADTGLHMPDFRAAERTFQLITQVSGRAGRGDRPGRVIVQTFFPDHYAIKLAAEANYEGFVARESKSRKLFAYPPFGRLIKIMISGQDEAKVASEAKRVGELIKPLAPSGLQVLGPVASPIAKIQNRHRMQILLKSREAAPLHALLGQVESELKGRRGADIIVDVDPQSLL